MYNYREYNPDIRLSPWVNNYWFATDFVESEVTPKVFPDGCTDIIFEINMARGTSSTNLFGMMTTFVEVDSPVSSQMFGIRFKPAGITAFTRMPINELTDRNVELALVDSLFGKSFYESLPEKKSIEEIITHTNNYLVKQLPLLCFPDKQIFHAVELIRHTKGQLNIADLASDVCLSQRHFERKFKSAIGVSPKKYARIFRFKHVLQSMIHNPYTSLLTIAEECGYYDRTHLINDFKMMTGDTPTEFRQEKSIFYAYGYECLG